MAPADRMALRTAAPLVAAEVVHDHDVTPREGWHEGLLDPGSKLLAVDRPVKHAGRVDPVVAQRGEEGQCPPMAERGSGDELVPAWSPAAQGCHIGLGPGLVDEDQASGINATLILFPLCPPSHHRWSKLLLGEQCFF